MIIEIANFWYFFFVLLSVGLTVGLYFLLKKRSQKTQKIVLFSLLIFALILHFLKVFIPPYSTNINRWYREGWFINICGANIALFPLLFLCKNKYAKDYMFYLGLLGGLLAVLYPVEPMQKADQLSETLDIIRFYIHHHILWSVPTLMVLLGIHKLEYKRVWAMPSCLLLVFLFIILNQIFQSELGYVPLRNDDFLGIGYKNSSFIWGPGDDDLAKIFTPFCPDIFKTVPVGEFAGQEKYWPWFWMIVPVHVILIPLCFLISLIFDFKTFKSDMIFLKDKFIQIKNKLCAKKGE